MKKKLWVPTIKDFNRAGVYAHKMCEARQAVIEAAKKWHARRYSLDKPPGAFHDTWILLYKSVTNLLKLERGKK